MKKIRFHINHIKDYKMGRIDKLFGYYRFGGCDCSTCVAANLGKSGWGFQLLFFGFSIS